MSRLGRVIVGVSGSPGSIRALRYAEEMARPSNALLVPVLAWTTPGGEGVERRAPSAELRRVCAAAAARRLLDALTAAWAGRPEGLTVKALAIRGEPGPVLVETACEDDDLLVVGAGRRTAGTRLWHGRVARYCLRRATCPVLAVPPADLGAATGLRGWAFRHRELTVDRALRGWSAPAA